MKRFFVLVLICLLLLSSCSSEAEAPRLQVTATVYPVAMAAAAVCQGVPGVRVEQMVADTGGCVHDYSLSVRDLQKLESADVLVLSGAGLESFLDGLLSRYPELAICDSGAEVETLCADHDHDHEEGHDHGEEADPHIWMDPLNLAAQTRAIARYLAETDPAYEEQYLENGEAYCRRLLEADAQLTEMLSGLSCRELITFHEGFGYFAERYGFHVTGIEEEAGGEASAQVLAGLAEKIREEEIPAVFYEENGSERSAQVLSRECSIPARSLSLLMDGDGTPEGLIQAMLQNGRTIAEVYAE